MGNGFWSQAGSCAGEGNGNPFQYSFLENSMVKGAVGYRQWGRKESATTEWLTHTHTHTQVHVRWLSTVVMQAPRVISNSPYLEY